MKQGVYVEQVLLRVNGGVLNDDGAVQKADIRAYIPTALNYVTSKAYYTNIKEEDNRDFPGSFYATYPNVAINRSTTPPTIVLPKKAMPLASNQGIRYIADDCGNPFVPVSDGDYATLNFYKDLMPNTRFYKPFGGLVQLHNLNKQAGHCTVVLLQDGTTFTDDDDLPVQAGMETDVIDLSVQFFTGQRQMPADVTEDTKDVNAV